jgi:hypothetical protein
VGEVSCCDFFSEKDAYLKKSSLFHHNLFDLFFFENAKELFKNKMDLRSLSLSYTLKKSVLVSFGEVSEKALASSNKRLTFLRIHLSSFFSQGTSLKKDLFDKSLLGKLLLPKESFVEGSFDFISTLGRYKTNVCQYHSAQSTSKTSLKYFFFRLSSSNKNLLKGLDLFVLHSNGDVSLSVLRSFPVYLNSGFVCLTEIKSVSLENFFKEDSFLKKSPKLISLVSVFHLFRSNFN